MGGGKSVSLKGRAGERADEEEAGEGMRWGEKGLEFLTVSKLEIRGSPSSQSFQMMQGKKKKLVPPGNLNAFCYLLLWGKLPLVHNTGIYENTQHKVSLKNPYASMPHIYQV